MAEKQSRRVSVLVEGVRGVDFGKWDHLRVVLEFKRPEDIVSAALSFLSQIETDQDLVQAMVERVDKTPLVYNDFRMKLIQILEEKFGLLVRVCINCRHFEPSWPPVLKREDVKPDRGQCARSGLWYPATFSCTVSNAWEPKSKRQ